MADSKMNDTAPLRISTNLPVTLVELNGLTIKPAMVFAQ